MKTFYRIVPNLDGSGTVDVWLSSGIPVPIKDTSSGLIDYNIKVLAVRGVVPWDGLEEDIRERYEAWCASAEVIEI